MDSVRWISHRGYCESSTENTLRSFDAAVAMGFRHIETDLRATKDGHIVLHHDPDLLRTCGNARVIGNSRWDEIQEIRTRDGQSLMRLPDLIKRYPTIHWTFDVKTPDDLKTLTLIAEWARVHGKEEWIHAQARFLLWSRAGEQLVQEIFPEAPTLAQESECFRAGLSAIAGIPGIGGIKPNRIYSLPSRFKGIDLFSGRILKAYHQRGARLLAYLPGSEHEAINAYNLGFDEILTNGRKLF